MGASVYKSCNPASAGSLGGLTLLVFPFAARLLQTRALNSPGAWKQSGPLWSARRTPVTARAVAHAIQPYPKAAPTEGGG